MSSYVRIGRYQAERRCQELAAFEGTKSRRRLLQACAGQPFSGDVKGIHGPDAFPDTLMDSHQIGGLTAESILSGMRMDETGELAMDPGTGQSLATETYTSRVPSISQNQDKSKKGTSHRLPKMVWPPPTVSPTSKSVTLLRELQGLAQGIGVI